jgi:hypothetical protein
VTRDRYLNVDDPRDPAPPPARRPAAGIEEPPPAAGTPAPAPESEADRCLRAAREVLLGQPVPHSLEAAYQEVERRVREGGAG